MSTLRIDPPTRNSESVHRPGTWQTRLRAASHVVTRVLGRRFPQSLPLVYVTGYPKTGSTWACQLIADYLVLPFPRYALLPVGFEAVVHGHEPISPDYQRGVYVMRDGRDALVSQYFFICRTIPAGDYPTLPRGYRHLFRGMKNKADVVRNLPAFLEQILTHRVTARPWPEHVRGYYEVNNKGIVMLRYEDLVTSGASALAEAMARMTGAEPDIERAQLSMQKFSFEKLRKAPAGHQGAAFLRKGRAGDWVNYFTRESAEIFDRHAGEMLVRAGYEMDRSWVGSVPSHVPEAETGTRTSAPSLVLSA